MAFSSKRNQMKNGIALFFGRRTERIFSSFKTPPRTSPPDRLCALRNKERLFLCCLLPTFSTVSNRSLFFFGSGHLSSFPTVNRGCSPSCGGAAECGIPLLMRRPVLSFPPFIFLEEPLAETLAGVGTNPLPLCNGDKSVEGPAFFFFVGNVSCFLR